MNNFILMEIVETKQNLKEQVHDEFLGEGLIGIGIWFDELVSFFDVKIKISNWIWKCIHSQYSIMITNYFPV